MTNAEEINKISNPIIKGRRPVYYFISEEKLNNLKYDSIIGDITFALFSISIAASISEKNWIYSLFGVFFLIFSIYFYSRKFVSIKEAQSSGEVQSFEYEATEGDENKLRIIKAIYGTPPDKVIDITENLNKDIVDNKLSRTVSNDIAGDPNKGAKKSLEIEYKIGNKIIQKRYTEGEVINLP